MEKKNSGFYDSEFDFEFNATVHHHMVFHALGKTPSCDPFNETFNVFNTCRHSGPFGLLTLNT